MARMATNSINEDRTFNCEALSIFTCKNNTTLGAKDLRLYFKKHWRKIFQGMNNSTILFIAGVHGDQDGKLGDRKYNLKAIENQVGRAKEFYMLSWCFILFFIFFFSLTHVF